MGFNSGFKVLKGNSNCAALFMYISPVFLTPCHLVLATRGPYWSVLGHAVAQMVEATSRKVAGSIPNGVNGIFYWHNPSGRTMALGSTQPLTEMSTRNIFKGERRPVRKADNLTTFMCQLSWNLGVSTSWKPQGLSRPVMGLLYLFNREYCTIVYTSTDNKGI